jgi:hypothetical protein
VLNSQTQIRNPYECLNLSFILLFLMGCVPVIATQPPTPPMPIKQELQATWLVTETHVKKNTEEQTSKSPTVTPTTVTASCPIVQDVIKDSFLTKGTIIINPEGTKAGLQKYSDGMDSPIEFLKQLPCCTYMLYPSSWVSLDQKWLALINERYDAAGKYIGTNLIITNGDDTSPLIIPKTKKWMDIYTWLNGTQLFLYPSDKSIEGTYLLFDPFNMSMKEIKPAFPDLLPEWVNYRPIGWMGAPGRPIYDPTLTKVVYYWYSLDNVDRRAVVLWDLKTNQEIWRKPLTIVPIPVGEVTQPKWAPDGEQFAPFTLTAGREDQIELLLVDRNGKETKVTDLGMPKSLLRAGGMSWSPNGKYLSFFIEDQKKEDRLLVFDLTIHKIWDTCITEPEGKSRVYFREPVVWSPDSSQFLVRSGEAKIPFYLAVDVKKREITSLNFHFSSAVWLSPIDTQK